MRIRLTFVVAGVGHDLVLESAEATSVTRVRHAVAAELGVDPELPWWAGRRPLPGAALVGGSGLRDGARVHLGAPAPPRDDGSPLHLAVVNGPGAGSVLGLGRGVHVVGRAPDCDLPVADAEMSRRHVAVTVTAGGITVRDLDTRNGTTCDGAAVDRDGVDLVTGAVVRAGNTSFTLRRDRGRPLALRPGTHGRVLVLRPDAGTTDAPRTLTEPAAMPGPARPRIAWLGAAVPAAAGMGLAWWLHAWQFLAFAALTPVAILATAAGDRWSWRRSRRRDAAERTGALAAFAAERDAAVADEVRGRHRDHPDPAVCAAAAGGPCAPLWQRSPDLSRAWHVRIALADRPSATRVVDATGATGAATTLSAVPVCADLRRGPLGLAGPAATAVARAAVVQLLVALPPGAFEVVVVAATGRSGWDWLRWAPHGVHRIDAAADPAALAALGARARVAAQSVAGTTTPPPVPLSTLVIVDRVGALAGSPGLDEVLTHGTAAGIATVVVDSRPTALPSPVTSRAVVSGRAGARLLLDGVGWDTPDGRADALGPVVADLLDPAWCEELARALAPWEDGGHADEPPDQVSLADVVATTDPAGILARWAEPSTSRAPLRAVVGLDRAGPVVVDLDAHGPHALVAGTTGAGKSELLRSWIAALAVEHPPDDLSLLLVDYKGGAAFDACAALPHTLGVVTDLDRHLTARVLRSLDAELRHRERTLAAAGVSDLAAHRRARDPQDTTASTPLARLLVVVDEFATLAADLPEFVTGLVDVAQRGRSLGVHLVLATQRPGHAVSPTVRANCALRIALRVTDAAESMDVVGTDLAARLDPARPGRAVLRLGGTVRTVQTAWAAAPVSGGDEVTVRRLAAGRTGATDAADPTGPPDRTALDRVVEAVTAAWAVRIETGVRLPRRTWLPPLPDVVRAGALPDAPPGTVAIGVRDEPDRQRQVAEVLDLRAGGAVLAVGAARTGRTSLLHTIGALAVAQGARLAVLDDGSGLAALTTHAATAAHAVTSDPDSVQRFVDLLERETAARRHNGVTGPPLVVLVDDLPRVAAALEAVDPGQGLDRLLACFRLAGATGVTAVATGDRTCLAGRVASAADRILLFRPADAADAALVGLAPRDVPDHLPPGRALTVPGGEVVQVAVAAPPADGAVTAPPLVTGLRLRPLPTRVTRRDLPATTQPGALTLGVGGDDAAPVTVDPWAGEGRWLVAGPPRSGRSSTLVTLGSLAERDGARVLWWGRPGGALAAAAGAAGWARFAGGSGGGDRTLVLVDDAGALDDAVGDALADALRSAAAGRLAVVLAGRADDLLVGYRGVVAEVRRARRGLLLRPGTGDGELVGIRTGRARPDVPPGRGVLVAEGTRVGGREVGATPVTIHLLAPGPSADLDLDLGAGADADGRRVA